MKKVYLLPVIVITLGILLTGCPVSSTYPLGEQEKAEPINRELLGTWVNTQEGTEANKIVVEKGKEKNTYEINVIEKGSSFMADGDKFIAWVTTMNDLKFMVLKEILIDNKTPKYYVYNFTVRDNELTTHDITLKVKGTDAITSIQAYREEVAASINKEDFLQGRITWNKE